MTNTILGKPVIKVHSGVFNPKSGFGKKGLCDGLTFTAGTACAYNCQYCYVQAIVGRRQYVKDALRGTGLQLREVVIRRLNPVARLELALGNRFRGKKWQGKVVYASPLVDVAATVALAAETVELVKTVIEQTDLDIRLLSKSPLLESHVAGALAADKEFCQRARQRVIFGLSTGTLDEGVARVIEPNVPAVRKRLAALEKLQNHGWRTFAMLCPVLPQDAEAYAMQAKSLICFERCENVWAEVLNPRGDSMQLTLAALDRAGLTEWADSLREVSTPGANGAWEEYARQVFKALVAVVPKRHKEPRLKFLQYTRRATEDWWRTQTANGAVLL
ncbi:MAG: hypothetical protein QM813_03200 [Verrucomicrobiota bacterium]